MHDELKVVGYRLTQRDFNYTRSYCEIKFNVIPLQFLCCYELSTWRHGGARDVWHACNNKAKTLRTEGKVRAHELIRFVINCNIIIHNLAFLCYFWRIFTDIYIQWIMTSYYYYQISVCLFQESGSHSHSEGSRIPPFCKPGRASSGRIAEKWKEWRRCMADKHNSLYMKINCCANN